MKRAIDYLVLTWNSEKTLAKTLKSIEAFGKPNKIIIVDKFSNDSTLKIARKFDCLIIQTNEPLGSARFMGAKKAETPFIAYVDSDVELTEGWKKLLWAASSDKYERAGAFGAIYKGYKWTPTLSYFAFGCSIVKRQLILEFEDMQKYSAAEDSAFDEFLKKKKLKWYILPIEVKHHHECTGIPDWLTNRWFGAGGRVAGRNFLVVLGSFLISFLGVKNPHAPRNPNLSFVKDIKSRYNYLIGYILYRTYYEIDRSKKDAGRS